MHKGFDTILCINDLMPEFISCARIESNSRKIYRDLLRVIMGQLISTETRDSLEYLGLPKNFDWSKLRAIKLNGKR